MKFIKKLHQNILDSMYYVELQVITYLATAYIVYIVLESCREEYHKGGAIGWAVVLTISAALLYLVIFCCIFA